MAKERSLYIINALRRLSDQHLKDFHVLANSQEFDSVKDAVKNIQHNTMVNFFNLSHQLKAEETKSEADYSKGIIFGLSILIRIIEASPEEGERREGKRKKPNQ